MRELVAVLVDIRSVHNVGSIFRTADGAGIKKIFLCGITPEPVDRLGKLRPEFAKVALGAERTVAWEKRTNASVLMKGLKREGYALYAVEQARSSTELSRLRPKLRAALIVGNEVNGLPRNILRAADEILEIPMRGKKESLNVSVAFGIVAYHAMLSGRNRTVRGRKAKRSTRSR